MFKDHKIYNSHAADIPALPSKQPFQEHDGWLEYSTHASRLAVGSAPPRPPACSVAVE